MQKPSINVYLAGGYFDDRMQQYMQQLCALPGIRITHDWMDKEARLLPNEEAAVFDLYGVQACDLFIAVMDLQEYAYRGTFTELGAALALKKPVLVVRGARDQHAASNCFFWHPRIVHVTSFAKALQVVRAVLNPRRKLLLLGHGGHGKDTMAEALREQCGLRFASSSETANQMVVYPQLCEKYAYASEQECFDDRRQHRMEWYELICAYNNEDKARLAKQILAQQDMYVGMRDQQEFEATRPLVDLVLWVDASQRLPLKDPSLFIAQDEADLCVPNNGTLLQFASRILCLGQLLNIVPVDRNNQ